MVVFLFFTKWQADNGWQTLPGQRLAGSAVGRNIMYVAGATLRAGSQDASALRVLSRCCGAVENSVFFLFTFCLNSGGREPSNAARPQSSARENRPPPPTPC